ncbi:hypothetical protein WA026_020647 [Henosepilachna vigintioctopunctata]|uniref:AMP-binding enzyme C-terminal domain-containing protein n=1 Tax=Henosepilachna vigintioctopunctata TaxID=420089 RepID=A0AAW1UBM0_9CUCU
MLENILKSHPAVQNAAVIGIPDEEDGEHPLAFVVMKEGLEHKMSPKQLEFYVEEKVQDRQRLRGGVKIVDSIPLTNTGKIKRNILKNLYFNGEI